jgi:hypothetical protein
MDDDDDEIDGLSPTSMWRRNRKRKRKDFSDDEDYMPDEEEEHMPEEEDCKPVVNIGSPSATPPAPVPVFAVRVNVSLRNKRRGAFISSGEKVSRHALANWYPLADLFDRESQSVASKHPPGDWDHKIPKMQVQSPEWKPSRET